MVKVCNASVADSAVLGTQRTQASTSVAQTGEYYVTFLPLVKVWNLFDGMIVTIWVKSHVTWILTIGHHPTEPHQQIPIDEAVVWASKNVPSDGNTLLSKIKISNKQ
jgi:hypothetical protein